MPRMDVPPTKSNLRKIKSDLEFAYEGFDLLDQKREILVLEIMKHVGRVRELEERLGPALEELYSASRIAAMEMGSDIFVLKGHSEKPAYSLRVETARFMGIPMPSILMTPLDPALNSSPCGTTAMYDEARRRCVVALALLAEYAAVMKSVFVLSRELKKVQRKVNALEKIFIPRNEDAKKYISDRLEESDREEIFIKKLIRQRTEKGGEARGVHPGRSRGGREE
jgi:V/A-type H+/Na+-transporting ATPase subunit D